MAETGAPDVQTMTLSEFARKRDIDSELLKLLARGGHISAIPTRNGFYRMPVDSPLTAEHAETKGREIYNDQLEAVGRLLMKAQSRMRRLLDEIEQQQVHLDDVIPLGPGLANASETFLGRDEQSKEAMFALYQLDAWNSVLRSIDEMNRFHAQRQAESERLGSSSVSPQQQLEHAQELASPQWGERPTPLADELPDGVDDLSPEARRTVLDLLRVLVVAESGGTAR
ncbi:hypothetical protein ACT4S5_13210 [Kocuria oceani]|uniref:hypothetical protein n=1 Tax=Kocuria oceani TaxID=988827 RepID=UPI0040371000